MRDGKITESIFVEGLRLCEEALRSNLSIEVVIYSNQIGKKPRARQFIDEIPVKARRVVAVSEQLLESISYTATPQGIVLLAKRPRGDRNALKNSKTGRPLLVIMHKINNPVNVGAIIRTAEAAGCTGAIATRETSDPFSPKSVRGAMGSAFRVPIWLGATYPEVIAWCSENKIKTICSAAKGNAIYTSLDWTVPCAVILGAESTGLSVEELNAADETVAVPMQGSVESLNVAVTAGVLLYEALRQRTAQ